MQKSKENQPILCLDKSRCVKKWSKFSNSGVQFSPQIRTSMKKGYSISYQWPLWSESEGWRLRTFLVWCLASIGNVYRGIAPTEYPRPHSHHHHASRPFFQVRLGGVKDNFAEWIKIHANFADWSGNWRENLSRSSAICRLRWICPDFAEDFADLWRGPGQGVPQLPHPPNLLPSPGAGLF